MFKVQKQVLKTMHFSTKIMIIQTFFYTSNFDEWSALSNLTHERERDIFKESPNIWLIKIVLKLEKKIMGISSRILVKVVLFWLDGRSHPRMMPYPVSFLNQGTL